jgi:hypothetical protein
MLTQCLLFLDELNSGEDHWKIFTAKVGFTTAKRLL